MFQPNLKFVASPVSDIIAIGVLGRDCEPRMNLGEEQAVGGRDSTVETALVIEFL